METCRCKESTGLLQGRENLFIIQINNSLNTLVVNRHKENEEIKRVIGLMIIGVISNIGGIHAEHRIYVGNFQTSFMTENDQ